MGRGSSEDVRWVPSGLGVFDRKWIQTMVLCALLHACAAIHGERPPELLEMQDFVDQTARTYGIARALTPTLFTGTAAAISNLPRLTRPIPPIFAAGHLILDRRMLDSPHLPAMIAQALGVRVLGYESHRREWPYVITVTERQASNTKAVEILVRVRKVSEADAVAAMRSYVIALGGDVACHV